MINNKNKNNTKMVYNSYPLHHIHSWLDEDNRDSIVFDNNSVNIICYKSNQLCEDKKERYYSFSIGQEPPYNQEIGNKSCLGCPQLGEYEL